MGLVISDQACGKGLPTGTPQAREQEHQIKSRYVTGDSRAHVTISILCPTLMPHHIQIVKVRRRVLYMTDSLI